MRPNTPRRTVVTAMLLAAGAMFLYVPALRHAPFFLVPDELYSALTARAVATTGRDPHGAFLPLYFQMDLLKHGRPMWFQPLLIYAMAASIKVLPFSETAIRLPMAVIGVVNVVLAYFVGRLLFDRERYAVAPAVLLALTPAHFMYSRVAMDFAAPLPFVLGWLLCVLTYVKRGDARLLFGAGLILGFGLYSYVAAAAFMPLYAALTTVVLYLHRAPRRGYLLLAAGFVIPASAGLLFLLLHPTMLRDVAVHYQPDASAEPTSAGSVMTTMFAWHNITLALARYGRFWNPRFLFIDGPLRSTPTWLVGVFLLPVASALLFGTIRLLRHPSPHLTLLLLGGLLTAPLPASFVDQDDAIQRALELLPFAALIAALGLESFRASRATAGRWIAFAAFWSIVVALAIASHAYVPRAQAFVRAATVPLAVAGLMTALEGFRFESLLAFDDVVAAGASLVAAQIAYQFGYRTTVEVALAASFTIVLRLRGAGESRPRRFAVAVFLALLTSDVMFVYVDYFADRVGPIPAIAALLAYRLGAAAIALALASAVALAARRFISRADGRAVVAAALVAAACLETAYFYVDLFDEPRLRVVCVGAVVVMFVATGVLAAGSLPVADRLADLTAVGVIVIVSLQFGYVYRDYFGAFQARNSGSNDGNVRIAFEATADVARGRDVPAIYLSRLRNGGLGKFYADFYLLKHGRPDLLDRTVEGNTYDGLELDRILPLPSGSLVIVNASDTNDPLVDGLAAAGEITKHARLAAPDGTPVYWILERTRHSTIGQR